MITHRLALAACGFSLSVITIAASSIAHVAVQSPPPPKILIIDDVTLIDVENSRAIPHQSVTIQGERIDRIDPADKTNIPEGATVIAGKGLFLAPGLFDAHVHFSTSPETFGPMLLAHGVTAVRDTGADTTMILALREKSRAGGAGSLMPDIFCTGAIIDGDPPVWFFSEACDTPEEARAAVRKLKDAGVDQIKVYSRLLPEVYRAAVEEAHAVGLKATGHIPNAVTLADGIAAGQDCAEHLMGLDKLMVELSGKPADDRQSVWPGLSGWMRFPDIDKAKLREALAPLAKSKMVQCPTLVVMRGVGMAADPATADKDERMAYVPVTLRGFWGGGSYAEFGKFAGAMVPHMQAMVGELHRAGVPLMIGTDLANPYVFAGFSVHDEMRMFQDAGIPAGDVLRSATSIPARFLDAADDYGSIAPGKLASLVLLRANPLDDIANASQIQGVMVRGVHHDRAALDKMLADVRTYVADSSPAAADANNGIDMNIPGELVARGRYAMKFNGQFAAGVEDFVITRDKAGFHIRVHSQPLGGFQVPSIVDFHIDSNFKFIDSRMQQLSDKPIVATYMLRDGTLIATPLQGAAADAKPQEFKMPADGVVAAPVSAADFAFFGAFSDLKVDESRNAQAIGFGFAGWQVAAIPYTVTRKADEEITLPDGTRAAARRYATTMSAQGMEIKGDVWLHAEHGYLIRSVLRAQFGTIETALESVTRG